MKRLALAVLAACLYGSPALGSDTAANGVTIGGKAEPICAIKGPSPTEGLKAELNASLLSPNEISFGANIVDGTGALRPVRFSIKISILCNLPHTILVETIRGGLIDMQDMASIHIDYRATLSWKGQQRVLFTRGTPGERTTPISVGYAAKGDANLLFEMDPTLNNQNIPTEQGRYGDVIAIVIGPMI
jgi:hypothetical protein